MNLGLSLELKKNLPNLEQIARTEIKDIAVSNPQWMSGFTTGEGSFWCLLPSFPSHPEGVGRVWVGAGWKNFFAAPLQRAPLPKFIKLKLH